MMKRFTITFATVAATLMALALLWRCRAVVMVFLVSLAIAAALRPLADALAARGWKRSSAIGVVYGGVATILMTIVVVVANPLAAEIEEFSADLNEVNEVIDDDWPEGTPFEQAIARYRPTVNEANEVLESQLGVSLREWLLSMSISVAGMMVDFVLILFLSMYWSFDRVRFERMWLSLLSVDDRRAACDLWRSIELEIGRYLRSEIIQGIAAGAILYFAFRATGQPYPMLVASVGGLAWMIPWIGGLFTVVAAAAVAIPAVLLGQGDVWTLPILAATMAALVLASLEFVVEPRIFDRRRYNSLLVVILTIGFAELFGPLGLLIGPPVAAAIQITVEFCAMRRVENEISDEAILAFAPTIRERVVALRTTIIDTGERRPQVLSLVDRLESLIDDAENALPRRRLVS